MTVDQVKPVFIFSLPRSGSTLLQRVLTGHSEISSFAEPHFLLPLIGIIKKEGIVASYSHQSAYKGVKDVIDNLPEGEASFYKLVNDFSLKIYDSLSDKGSTYFLDKTPRYVWIISEIAKAFPEAKFIFLFRNPIQIYASLMSTYCSGNFYKMYRFSNFINTGFETLSKRFIELKSRSINIEFEDFLRNPEENLIKIYNYLELDHEMDVIEKFSNIDLKGKSVDPVGPKLYHKLSLAPLTKWKKVFNSKYRNQILSKYVKSLDDKSLEIQGYDKNMLLEEINSNSENLQPSRLADFIDIRKSQLVKFFNLNLFFDFKMSWTKSRYLN